MYTNLEICRQKSGNLGDAGISKKSALSGTPPGAPPTGPSGGRPGRGLGKHWVGTF